MAMKEETWGDLFKGLFWGGLKYAFYLGCIWGAIVLVEVTFGKDTLDRWITPTNTIVVILALGAAQFIASCVDGVNTRQDKTNELLKRLIDENQEWQSEQRMNADDGILVRLKENKEWTPDEIEEDIRQRAFRKSL